MKNMIDKRALRLMWLFLVSGTISYGDSLDLYTCFASAELLSPLKKQEILIQTAGELSRKNISTAFLPEITLSGKASYQSPVFAFPIKTVIQDVPVIPNDQYQASLNVKQNIFDAGITRNQKMAEDSRILVSESQLHVDLFAIKDIVSQLYFSALILQENIKTLNNSKSTLESQQKTMQSRIDNGVVLPSVLFSIQKELLNIDQRITQLNYDRKTSLELLSIWTGIPADAGTHLTIPVDQENKMPQNNRPELTLFRNQQQLLEKNKSLSVSRQLPSLYAFAQGGFASPNPFDMFQTDFSTFYIVGLQLSWKPFNWGYSGREKQILQVQQDQVSTRQEDFERNIEMGLRKEINESDKLRELVSRDDEIISLQKKITEQYFAQLQNGVITPTEYLAEFNSLTNAEVSRQSHLIMLSQSAINLLIRSGNIDKQ